jgi:hypothetical protein
VWKRFFIAASALTAIWQPAQAQELEPRAYSPSPIGTNFLVGNFTRLDGDVLTDPSVAVKNVQAKIDVYLVGYAYTFALAGHTASLGAIVPYAHGHISGDVFEEAREIYRAGIGDMRLRFAMNLYGSPALTPREFAQREPGLAVGASVSVIVPTGQYVPSRVVNVGSNRWAVKPELGFSYPFGNWFMEGSAGAWIFADNSDFFGGRRRSQEALYVTQVHLGYNFKPGLWIAVNGGHYNGGRTTVAGKVNDDAQNNSRYGATLSVPFGSGWSGKVAWSNGFALRAGGDYKVISLTLQYRWFDR